MSSSGHTQGPKPKAMWLAAAGAAALAVAGGAAFWLATQKARTGNAEEAFLVVVGNRACEPNEITVPAGRRAFEIVNRSDRPVEWEILSGVMVVEEVENIAPGFRQTLTAKLIPGSYEMTCGLLSNPRGKLVVTPSHSADAEATRPSLKAFIGPLSEYKLFLATEASALISATEKLNAALKSGDIGAARAAYTEARRPYMRVEAMSHRFADLDNSIDAIADYLEKREADAGFLGFHRIEYGLFAQGTLDGLVPIADKLAVDITALADRLRGLRLAPEDLAGGAARLATRLGERAVAQGENHYAHTDLSDFEANLVGIEKIVVLLRPVLQGAFPDVTADIDSKLATARDTVARLKRENGFPGFDKLDENTRRSLAKAFQDLAGALAKLNPAIGLG